MKRLVICSITLSFLVGCVTIIPKEKRTTISIVELPGMTKDKIYAKSIEWATKSFISTKAVFDYQNKEEGKIIGNFNFPMTYNLMYTAHINSQFTIEAKDNKVRLTLIAFTLTDPKGNINEINDYFYDDVKKGLDDTYTSYKTYMQTTKKDDNW